tara:strand:- start:344 stop:547 length:204 start_codon:yes stop_codon:yes gene_type:complete
MTKKDVRGVVDKFLERYTSRKLLVWAVSTLFLVMGDIAPDQWVAISLGYVGIEGFADLATAWKAAGK